MKKTKLILFLILIIALVMMTFGIHYKTTINGTHTGVITAIETNGIIFKTTTVYVKTNPMSSQEDEYCLIDKSLIPELQKLEESTENVTVIYNNYLYKGFYYCNGEPAIITGTK